MPHDVFISHSSQDRAAADIVCAALESRGIACWIAPRDVRPGKPYGAELIQAITGAGVMVLLHSRASNESPQVHKEAERADAKGVAIVSFRIERCDISDGLEYFLSSVQWIDATRPPLEDHVAVLAKAVQALLAERAPLPAELGVRSAESVEARLPPREVVRPARPRTPAIAAAVLEGVALVAVGGWQLARHRMPPATPQPPPSGSATTAAPGHGIAITAHPPPKTINAEAAAAYAAGLQNIRDASLALGFKDLRRAVKLDPSLAAANLRLSFQFQVRGGSSSARGQFAATSQFRAELDERDTALLAFAEAATAEPAEPDEAVRRIQAVANRFPEDAEVAFDLAGALIGANRYADARVAAQRAVALDPQFAAALWMQAATYFEEGDWPNALASFKRCLEISPMAASCLRSAAHFHDENGECTVFEAESRRLVSVEPDGPNAHWWVARALAARSAPVESVRAALDKATALGGIMVTVGLVPGQVMEDAVFALLTGDLARAESAGFEIEKDIAGSTSERDHGHATEWLMTIAGERGDTKQELSLADEHEKHVPAWTPNDPGGVRLWRLYLLHQTGQLDDAAFQEQRDRLYREALSRQPPTVSPRVADLTRVEFYADYAGTPAEATDALAHLTGGGRRYLLGLELLPIGRVYLLAGKVDEALPLLRAAAGSCSILPADDTVPPDTIMFLRANLLLGEALERTGDKAGACAAYAKIPARWEHPTPRSITVEAARAALKRLRCAG